MAIHNPTQKDCDDMSENDIIFVKPRSLFYKLYRKFFLKDKIKIMFRELGRKGDIIEAYQEDCVLIYGYEIQCICSLKNEVPCMISKKPSDFTGKTILVKELKVGLNNIQIIFNDMTYTIPTAAFENAIKSNQYKLKQYGDSERIKEYLKFQKLKGEDFKKIALEKNITSMPISYCTICGKPVHFKFEEDNVKINNECECGGLTLNYNQITYDEFAIWYYTQINPIFKKRFDKIWFNKE